MADIRIKDLATTAASTASDDFIAVDGSANGTRKLNAYSPTFGGNLTVSGTTGSTFGQIARTNGTNATVLTLSDNLTGVSTAGFGLQIRGTSNNGGCVSAIGFENGGTGTNNETQFSVYTQNAANALTKQFTIGSTGNATLSGNLTVSGTGTSSFAGVLGVQSTAASYGSGVGQIYIRDSTTPTKRLFMGYDTTLDGGYIVSEQTGVANKSLYIQPGGGGTTIGGNLTVSGTGGISIGSATFTGGRALTATTGSGNNVGLRLLQTSVADWEIKNVATTGALSFAQSATEYARLTATGNLLLGTTTDSGNGKVQLADHTTSAGGIGFGTDLSLYRANTGFLILNDASAALDARIGLYNNGTQRGLFEAYHVTSAVYMGAASAGWSTFITSGNQAIALTLDSSQNATFAGKITTSAPTGGAGAWELGVANTVSPTAPNRTITIEIGGTVYYLHAKTTND